jgi:hypothetical protein
MVRDGTARTAGLTRYDHDEAIRTSGINGEDLTKNWPKSCLNQGSIRGKSGLKVDENPVYVKADYWTMKSTIPKHVKQATQNHAKGGYHAALSNAVYP